MINTKDDIDKQLFLVGNFKVKVMKTKRKGLKG